MILNYRLDLLENKEGQYAKYKCDSLEMEFSVTLNPYEDGLDNIAINRAYNQHILPKLDELFVGAVKPIDVVITVWSHPVTFSLDPIVFTPAGAK